MAADDGYAPSLLVSKTNVLTIIRIRYNTDDGGIEPPLKASKAPLLPLQQSPIDVALLCSF